MQFLLRPSKHFQNLYPAECIYYYSIEDFELEVKYDLNYFSKNDAFSRPRPPWYMAWQVVLHEPVYLLSGV